MKIEKVEAFAGREASGIKVVSDHAPFDHAGYPELHLEGDLGGGIAILFSNGMKLMVGNEDGSGHTIEVTLVDADGEQVEGGSQSWSPMYHFEVPQA